MVKLIFKKLFPTFYLRIYKSYKVQKFWFFLKNPHPIKYLIYILLVIIILVFFFIPTTGIKTGIDVLSVETIGF